MPLKVIKENCIFQLFYTYIYIWNKIFMIGSGSI